MYLAICLQKIKGVETIARGNFSIHLQLGNVRDFVNMWLESKFGHKFGKHEYQSYNN